MSNTLIDRSADLTRLRNEGFNIEAREGFLLVKEVPYVNSERQVLRGTLVMALAGEATAKPPSHEAYFAGEVPCHRDGVSLSQIITGSQRRELAPDISVDHHFSAKPPEPYPDYYQKVTRYVTILSGPARMIVPGVTAQTYAPVSADSDDEVFLYLDTATSRAEIGVAQAKLRLSKVAIVGLGGTGSYVLDLVAKTPVREIHLFDGDLFLQHNAFRAPGAPSLETLQQHPRKVAYWRDVYAKMRRGVIAHERHVDAEAARELQEMAFVFVCIDDGTAKKAIIGSLDEAKVPFVDVGMGVRLIDGALGGILRVTTGAGENREHVTRRIPMNALDGDNEYAKNIQIADLNALNAALAVIKWKKLFAFYADLEGERHSTYTIDGNMLLNTDKA